MKHCTVCCECETCGAVMNSVVAPGLITRNAGAVCRCVALVQPSHLEHANLRAEVASAGRRIASSRRLIGSQPSSPHRSRRGRLSRPTDYAVPAVDVRGSDAAAAVPVLRRLSAEPQRRARGVQPLCGAASGAVLCRRVVPAVPVRGYRIEPRRGGDSAPRHECGGGERDRREPLYAVHARDERREEEPGQ